MITREQVTLARDVLQWSIADLSRWSNVNRFSIFAFEVGEARLNERFVEQIQEALEAGGVEFPEDAPPRLKRQPTIIEQAVA